MLACETTSEVATFVREWNGSALGAFLVKHRAPFLLGEPAGLSAVGRFDTAGVPPPPRPSPAGERPTDRAQRPGQGRIPDRLLAVAKRPGAPFPHMISAGRAPNNDVVLPYGTVSKLHSIHTDRS